jgi:hypothetical protein
MFIGGFKFFDKGLVFLDMALIVGEPVLDSDLGFLGNVHNHSFDCRFINKKGHKAAFSSKSLDLRGLYGVTAVSFFSWQKMPFALTHSRPARLNTTPSISAAVSTAT